MNKNIRILIVEDEFITLDLIRDYLELSGYSVSGDAMKADEAIDILERFDTDLALLDINLKGEKDGIWIAEQIRQHYHIPFVFISAYSDPYTLKKATAVHPYGYLVKPFTQADIFAVVEVALQNYAKEHRLIELPEQHWTDGTELLIHDRIFVKDNLSYKKIVIDEIRYIQAFKNYIELNIPGRKIVIRSSLQRFLSILPSAHFTIIHRSFVVNLKYVEEITSTSIVTDLDTLPLSKSYKDDFVKKFNFFV